MTSSAFNLSLTAPMPAPVRIASPAARRKTVVIYISSEDAAGIASLSPDERRARLLALPVINLASAEEQFMDATDAVTREHERRAARKAARRRERVMGGDLSTEDPEAHIVGRKPTHAREVLRDVLVAISVNDVEHAALKARAAALCLSLSDFARKTLTSVDLATPESHLSAERVLAVAVACKRYAQNHGFVAHDEPEEDAEIAA